MFPLVCSSIFKSLKNRSPCHRHDFNRNLWKLLKGGFRKKSYEVVKPNVITNKRLIPVSLAKPEYWNNGIPKSPPLSPEIKSLEEIQRMRRTCKLASSILYSLREFIKKGITTDEIDEFVHEKCIVNKAYPSPLNYRGYPKSVCTSLNNVACHGIPDNTFLIDGDILNVDITVYREGCHGDCSAMFCVGEIDENAADLVRVCYEALEAGIEICRPGTPFAKIGKVIEELVEDNGFSVIGAFAGHGIGTYFHGPPDIYHIDYPYDGNMEEGMTFTIEPLISEGSPDVVILDDNWTAVSKDDSRSAQWEHTLLITSSGAEVLTLPPDEG